MGDATPALTDWNPLTPDDMAEAMRGFPGRWAIAGGWALDLHIGRQTRPHADIDVQIDRRDAPLLWRSLPGWQFHLAHGTVSRWHEGSPVPEDVSDIWCRQPTGPWKFQLMLGEFDDGAWYYRRDRSIQGPLVGFAVDIDGIPVIAPEIQLLYKSRPPMRAKDEQDFENALPILTASQRAWLAVVLGRLYGDHAWLPALEPR